MITVENSVRGLASAPTRGDLLGGSLGGIRGMLRRQASLSAREMR